MSEKPKDFISMLGPNVEMSSEKMENDEWASKHLKEIGAVLCKPQTNQGMQYMGSFAFHIFADKGLGITGKMSMGSLTQICLEDNCSEKLATLAFNNGVLELRRVFNPAATSGRRNDKR